MAPGCDRAAPARTPWETRGAMSSYRADKVRFFATIVQFLLLGAAITSTVWVLLTGGVAHLWAVKLTWGIWWVLCIITVLIRIALFRWQMMRAARAGPPGAPPAAPSAPEPAPPPPTGEPGERVRADGHPAPRRDVGVQMPGSSEPV